MTIWTRAESPTLCGRCPRLIEVDEPMQVITVDRVSRKFIRCQFCAEGQVPPDLPARIEQTTKTITPMAHIRTGAGALPFDFKSRQSGESD